VLDLGAGLEAAADEMAAVAERLGFTRDDGRRAWARAVARQVACFREGGASAARCSRRRARRTGR